MAEQRNPPVPETPNPDQLRARIDEGATGDKVPASDPAAAPLGTDAEAGGSRLDPADIARDMRDGGPPEPPAAAQNARGPAAGRTRTAAFVAVAIVVAVGAAVVAAVWMPGGP